MRAFDYEQDPPSERIDRVLQPQNLMMESATGRGQLGDEDQYASIRKAVMQEADTK